MFEVFGIIPLLLNCLLVVVFFFLAFFVGSLFKEGQDKGLAFIVGTVLIVSLYAFFNTGVRSFFTPVLFVTPFLLKIDLAITYVEKIKNAFRNSVSTSLIFIVMLLIAIIQFDYFSTELVYSNYPDFTFYS